MENRGIVNGNGHQTKLTRCSSSVGDSGTDKTKVGWTSPRDIWRNLSLRRKAEVNKTITKLIISQLLLKTVNDCLCRYNMP